MALRREQQIFADETDETRILFNEKLVTKNSSWLFFMLYNMYINKASHEINRYFCGN